MEYDVDMQYGADIESRMNSLWGDDDIIHGGNGDGTKKQYMFGGDGVDSLHFGDSWLATYGFGHDGNDKIYLPNDVADVTYYGGDGNDRVYAVPSDELNGKMNTNELGYGGPGDDFMQGSHKLAGTWTAHGRDDDDKIIGGDDTTGDHKAYGNEGDDHIKGGDGSMALHQLFGDFSEAEINDREQNGTANGWTLGTGGNDTIYGGDKSTTG